MSRRLRREYVRLIRMARKPDGYTDAQRLATLVEYQLDIAEHEGLTGWDRRRLDREVRRSIEAIQQRRGDTRGSQL